MHLGVALPLPFLLLCSKRLLWKFLARAMGDKKSHALVTGRHGGFLLIRLLQEGGFVILCRQPNFVSNSKTLRDKDRQAETQFPVRRFSCCLQRCSEEDNARVCLCA